MRSLIVLAIVLPGLGAAFLFVPSFHRMGVPLRKAMATALFRNPISLAFTPAIFVQGGMVRFRTVVPIVTAAGRVKVSKLSAEGPEQILHIEQKGALGAPSSTGSRARHPSWLSSLWCSSSSRSGVTPGDRRPDRDRPRTGVPPPNFFDPRRDYAGDGQNHESA